MGSVGLAVAIPGGDDGEVDGTVPRSTGRPTTVPSLVATGGDERRGGGGADPRVMRACAEPPDATAGRRRGRWRSLRPGIAEAVSFLHSVGTGRLVDTEGEGLRASPVSAGRGIGPSPARERRPLRCAAAPASTTKPMPTICSGIGFWCRTIRPRTTAMAGSRAISVPNALGVMWRSAVISRANGTTGSRTARPSALAMTARLKCPLACGIRRRQWRRQRSAR